MLQLVIILVVQLRVLYLSFSVPMCIVLIVSLQGSCFGTAHLDRGAKRAAGAAL